MIEPATPLPWDWAEADSGETGIGDRYSGPISPCLFPADNADDDQTICWMNDATKSMEHCLKDLRYIKLACNAFPMLLSVCEKLLQTIEEIFDPSLGPLSADDYLAHVKVMRRDLALVAETG